ncbi:exodeoxyribonuclease V subunit gamma [Nocardioides caeni]|uniref:RecBCD enzyme subunit RecC n=1 Tax=Nocardioides caeni TaxID=574700 RepID=A0A4S8N4X7_9ACTN|nr:exodeoxyribonuclease V subunit gamma [Nocardioides caeni]THV11197.1 exodeoxyribonuclease V subunit gamma [Nocardioides caeni]
MLTIHRGPGTAALADALGEVLATPPTDPFAKDLVVVPAKGVERWLAQRLSHRLGTGERGTDGVCAGIDFVRPRSLVALLTGTEHTDPWHPDRLAWPVLEVIDAGLGEPWAAPLARHLGEDREGVERELRRSRRYGLARRLAGLLSSYAVQRPGLLTDWAAGGDGGPDDLAADLANDLAWQPELWRRVLERVGATPPDERHRRTCAELAEQPDRFDLPTRLSLFGHTRIPVTEVELLGAVARHREVHLFLPQTSAVLWDDLRPVLAAGPVPRADDDSAAAVRHPLLATLGRDAREVQRQLAPLLDGSLLDGSPGGGVAEVVHPGPEPGNHLLGWLQADLRAATPPADTRHRVLDPADRSVQLHACHGAVRQVEVLRDVLLGLLDADPTLEPRDLLVMCPDVEGFAPLLHAVFGAVPDDHPARQLRVSMADRGLAATNPLLAIAGQLVALVEGRARATDVLDLVGAPPVRRRFRLTDDDLATITRWTTSSGVRWGLDAGHRRTHGLELGENTWRSGIDRILAGVAMPEEQVLLGSTLPLDDVGSSDLELAGRFAEAIARIEEAVAALAAAGTAAEWAAALLTHVGALTSTSYDDAWQSAQLDHELGRLAADSGPARLTVADVRRVIEDHTAPRPTRTSFRTGALTVSSLVPMRSVPHRVVCLLGMDADVFPRTLTVDGDDALARSPRTGERDARAEDRQLLLDAVLSARDALVITYAGMSEHSGQDKPPAIPVGELLDALDATAAGPVRRHVVTRQPLQPHDERLLAADDPRSFDPVALAAATAARHTQPAAPFFTGPVSPPGPDLTLDDLRRFLANPARALLDHLEIGLPFDTDPPSNDIPLAPGNLEKWAVGDRMVAALLAGGTVSDIEEAELRRGTLPPGALGRTALTDISSAAGDVVRAAAARRVGDPVTTDITLDLGDDVRLTGRVGDLHDDTIVRVTYSRLGAKHALELWLDVLAVQAMRPDRQIRGVVVAKGVPGEIRPVDPDLARATLAAWVRLRHDGLQQLCPLPLQTGRAWALGRGHRRTAWTNAMRKWQWDRFKPERDDPAWSWLLGPRADLDRLPDLGATAEAVWGDLVPFEKGWSAR